MTEVKKRISSRRKGRKRKGKNKGPQFERKFAKQLSLWWTGGKDDSVFWRTQSSGARATIRAKQGKRTEGQYGDIAATNEDGKKLLRLFTLSLKCGYNAEPFYKMIDGASGSKVWEQWIREAKLSRSHAHAHAYCIIHKIDFFLPTIVMGIKIWKAILKSRDILSFFSKFFPAPVMEVHNLGKRGKTHVVVMRLEDFFKYVTRKDIVKALRILEANDVD